MAVETVDINTVVAQLARPLEVTYAESTPPWTFAPIGFDFGNLLTTHVFSSELVVAYTVEHDLSLIHI